MCTKLVGTDGTTVRTIEHLMAALFAYGIDNAEVSVNGEEIPILDGSALPFLQLLETAGRKPQSATQLVAEVRQVVEVSMGPAWVRIEPEATFSIQASIEFPDEAIGRQSIIYDGSYETFRRGFAQCRTFCRSSDIDAMKLAGCARGGSLQNAVVIDGSRILTPGGLRKKDEPVRHKVLDMIGDLALFQAPLRGKVTAHRPGHAITNMLLRELQLKRSSWDLRSEASLKALAA